HIGARTDACSSYSTAPPPQRHGVALNSSENNGRATSCRLIFTAIRISDDRLDTRTNALTHGSHGLDQRRISWVDCAHVVHPPVDDVGAHRRGHRRRGSLELVE